MRRAFSSAAAAGSAGGGGGKSSSSPFGRLWGRGHETLSPSTSQLLRLSGPGATTFLQGLVTCNLLELPHRPRPEKVKFKSNIHKKENDSSPDHRTGMDKEEERLRVMMESLYPQNRSNNANGDGVLLYSACFLDHKGRIVTDSLLWKMNEHEYYIDCPSSTSSLLFQHLKQHKLRKSQVAIEPPVPGQHQSAADAAATTTTTTATATTTAAKSHVILGTLSSGGAPPGFVSALDPRHPSLGIRVLELPRCSSSSSPPSFSDLLSGSLFGDDLTGNYEFVRRLAGIASGSEVAGKTAIECNHEFLNSINFHKGCYLGQELTARVHHTGTVRKRIVPLLFSLTETQIPHIWNAASYLQRLHHHHNAATAASSNEKNSHTSRIRPDDVRNMPSRLPRLSVLAAGNLVALMTGSLGQQQQWEENKTDDDDDDADLMRASLNNAAELVETLQEHGRAGAKLVDPRSGSTMGTIVSPPLPGTNVVTAMMRLEPLGLLQSSPMSSAGSPTHWSNTNKIVLVNEAGGGGTTATTSRELRYLPYLPLWWPLRMDSHTGKASEDQEEDSDHDDDDDDDANPVGNVTSSNAAAAGGSSTHFARIEIEQLDEGSISR